MKKGVILLLLCATLLILCAGCSGRIGSSVDESEEKNGVDGNTENLSSIENDVTEVMEVSENDENSEMEISSTEASGKSTEECENKLREYYTASEMADKIETYFETVDETDRFIFTRDEYDDKIRIGIRDGASTLLKKEDDNYGLLFLPSIETFENDNGQTILVYELWIQYISGGFLDYIFDTDCTILADDGTKYKFLLTKTNQTSDDDYISYTDLICLLNISDDTDNMDVDDTNVKHMEELLEKDELSLRINYKNNDNEYPLEILDDEIKNKIRTMNELYRSLSDYLNY